MLPKVLPYSDVKRKLENTGFSVHTQKGSHIKFVKQTNEGIRTAIVPHRKELSIGILKSILRQAGINEEEFERL